MPIGPWSVRGVRCCFRGVFPDDFRTVSLGALLRFSCEKAAPAKNRDSKKSENIRFILFFDFIGPGSRLPGSTQNGTLCIY